MVAISHSSPPTDTPSSLSLTYPTLSPSYLSPLPRRLSNSSQHAYSPQPHSPGAIPADCVLNPIKSFASLSRKEDTSREAAPTDSYFPALPSMTTLAVDRPGPRQTASNLSSPRPTKKAVPPALTRASVSEADSRRRSLTFQDAILPGRLPRPSCPIPATTVLRQSSASPVCGAATAGVGRKPSLKIQVPPIPPFKASDPEHTDPSSSQQSPGPLNENDPNATLLRPGGPLRRRSSYNRTPYPVEEGKMEGYLCNALARSDIRRVHPCDRTESDAKGGDKDDIENGEDYVSPIRKETPIGRNFGWTNPWVDSPLSTTFPSHFDHGDRNGPDDVDTPLIFNENGCPSPKTPVLADDMNGAVGEGDVFGRFQVATQIASEVSAPANPKRGVQTDAQADDAQRLEWRSEGMQKVFSADSQSAEEQDALIIRS